MRARVRLDPWRGWYGLVGVSFPPGGPLAAVSRDPARMEIGAADTGGLVHGDWFDGS